MSHLIKIWGYVTIFIVLSFQVYSSGTDTSRVVVYEPFQSSVEYDTEDISIEQANCVKWNLALIGRGVFLFNYERMFFDQLTIELGFGATIRDYIYEAIALDMLLVEDFYREDIIVNKGFAFEIGPRFFPGGYENFNGVYFQPLYRLRKYYQYLKHDIDVGYSFRDACFIMGFQYDSWDWNINWDIYFGAGISSLEFVELEYNEIDDDYESKRYRKDRPLLLFGLKVGLPF